MHLRVVGLKRAPVSRGLAIPGGQGVEEDPFPNLPSVSSLPQAQLCRALYDNTAECPDELSFRKGDLMVLLQQEAPGLEGWYLCSLHGQQGIVPANRVQVLPEPGSPGPMLGRNQTPADVYQVPRKETALVGTVSEMLQDERRRRQRQEEQEVRQSISVSLSQPHTRHIIAVGNPYYVACDPEGHIWAKGHWRGGGEGMCLVCTRSQGRSPTHNT